MSAQLRHDQNFGEERLEDEETCPLYLPPTTGYLLARPFLGAESAFITH